jgi:hypothetical protein
MKANSLLVSATAWLFRDLQTPIRVTTGSLRRENPTLRLSLNLCMLVSCYMERYNTACLGLGVEFESR